MGVKDEMFRWFVKNIVMPRNEIIDNPGFIVLRISDNVTTINVREILLPEYVFLETENKIVKKYGDKGKSILYSVGKRFGYNFALISKYPKADNEKEFSKFYYFFARYLESIYANKIEHSIDFKNKQFNLKTKNWIVCNKNGLGYTLLDGAGTGMISYAFDDPAIEGVQLKCEGRGDDHCELICAPEAYFRKQGIKFFSERDLKDHIDILEYSKVNEVAKARYSPNSFRSLLDAGFLKYREGALNFGDERLVLIEASIMYLLETGLQQLKGGPDILWDASFGFGKKLGKIFGESNPGKSNPSKFITDFFPALGFGDILVLQKGGKYEVCVNYFPWTKWHNEVKYVIFRGMLSGVISGFEGRDVLLKNFRTDLTKGYFSLMCSE